MDKHLLIWKDAQDNLQKLKTHFNKISFNSKEIVANLEKEINESMGKMRNMVLEDRISEGEWLGNLRNRMSNLKTSDDKDQFSLSPYFAKITSDDVYYISRYNSMPDYNIYKWTAPIAALRFKDISDNLVVNKIKHEIVEKELFKIEDGQLDWLEHSDSDGTFDYDGDEVLYIKGCVNKQRTDVKPVAKKEERYNIEVINKSRESNKKKDNYKLTSIIELMKEEQDNVMRLPLEGVTLITGNAGSGKTNIALHRVKYILDEFPDKVDEVNVALFCFNLSLKNYLSNLITELGLKNMHVFSYDKWIKDILEQKTTMERINYNGGDDHSKYVKSRVEIVSILDEYLLNKTGIILSEINKDDLLSEYSSLLPIHKVIRLTDFRDFSDAIERKYSNIRPTKKKDSFIGKAMRVFGFKDKDEIDIETNSVRFDEIERRIEQIVDISYCKGWKLKEVGYQPIDAIVLLTDIYNFEGIKRYLLNNNITLGSINSLSFSGSDSYILGYVLSLILPDIFNKGKRYDHIIVDEIQDFSPIQISILKNINNNSMTFAGDLTQRIYNNGVESWDDLGIKIDNHAILKLSHRATQETILFANAVINKQLTLVDKQNIGRTGLKPLVIDNTNPILEAINQVKRIKQENSDASIAITCQTKGMANITNDEFKKGNIDSYVAMKDSWKFSSSVAITTYYQVKGLEFDYIIILGINNYENFSLKHKEKVLYTTITRAKKRVIIIYDSKMPRLISKVDKSLYEKI